MFDTLSIMLVNQLFYNSPALVAEAKTWLLDCGFIPMTNPPAVALQIRTYYDGGMREFMNNSKALLNADELASV